MTTGTSYRYRRRLPTKFIMLWRTTFTAFILLLALWSLHAEAKLSHAALTGGDTQYIVRFCFNEDSITELKEDVDELVEFLVAEDESLSTATLREKIMDSFEPGHGSRLKAVLMDIDDKAMYVRILAHPNVCSIERNSIVKASDAVGISATRPNPQWGLDRIDQESLPLDNSYTYDDLGGFDTDIYVVDTGVRLTHQEFGGRATFGHDVISDPMYQGDCNGHGTHVAGIAAGRTYGVAPNASIISVRVLDCGGSGTTAGILAGLEWVFYEAVLSGRATRSIINLSLGPQARSQTPSQDVLQQDLMAYGVFIAHAAGNENDDACYYSHAESRVAPIAVVGATDTTDSRAIFNTFRRSNYGKCVNVYAPGKSIVSASNDDDVSSRTLSGTSMAAPHVAGVAALYRAQYPSVTVRTVLEAILMAGQNISINDVISGSPSMLQNVLPAPQDVVCVSCNQVPVIHPENDYYNYTVEPDTGTHYFPNELGFDTYSTDQYITAFLIGPEATNIYGGDIRLEGRTGNGDEWVVVYTSDSVTSREKVFYRLGSTSQTLFRFRIDNNTVGYDFYYQVISDPTLYFDVNMPNVCNLTDIAACELAPETCAIDLQDGATICYSFNDTYVNLGITTCETGESTNCPGDTVIDLYDCGSAPCSMSNPGTLRQSDDDGGTGACSHMRVETPTYEYVAACVRQFDKEAIIPNIQMHFDCSGNLDNPGGNFYYHEPGLGVATNVSCETFPEMCGFALVDDQFVCWTFETTQDSVPFVVETISNNGGVCPGDSMLRFHECGSAPCNETNPPGTVLQFDDDGGLDLCSKMRVDSFGNDTYYAVCVSVVESIGNLQDVRLKWDYEVGEAFYQTFYSADDAADPCQAFDCATHPEACSTVDVSGGGLKCWTFDGVMPDLTAYTSAIHGTPACRSDLKTRLEIRDCGSATCSAGNIGTVIRVDETGGDGNCSLASVPAPYIGQTGFWAVCIGTADVFSPIIDASLTITYDNFRCPPSRSPNVTIALDSLPPHTSTRPLEAHADATVGPEAGTWPLSYAWSVSDNVTGDLGVNAANSELVYVDAAFLAGNTIVTIDVAVCYENTSVCGTATLDVVVEYPALVAALRPESVVAKLGFAPAFDAQQSHDPDGSSVAAAFEWSACQLSLDPYEAMSADVSNASCLSQAPTETFSQVYADGERVFVPTSLLSTGLWRVQLTYRKGQRTSAAFSALRIVPESSPANDPVGSIRWWEPRLEPSVLDPSTSYQLKAALSNPQTSRSEDVDMEWSVFSSHVSPTVPVVVSTAPTLTFTPLSDGLVADATISATLTIVLKARLNSSGSPLAVVQQQTVVVTDVPRGGSVLLERLNTTTGEWISVVSDVVSDELLRISCSGFSDTDATHFDYRMELVNAVTDSPSFVVSDWSPRSHHLFTLSGVQTSFLSRCHVRDQHGGAGRMTTSTAFVRV